MSAAAVDLKLKEYRRPDIVLLGGIRNSSDQIRDELKELGEEKRYPTALRVMETQAKLIAKLARELIDRYEAEGL